LNPPKKIGQMSYNRKMKIKIKTIQVDKVIDFKFTQIQNSTIKKQFNFIFNFITGGRSVP